MGVLDRLRGVGVRLRAALNREGAERELEDELRFHVEMETESGVAGGLDPVEARRRALVKFGGVERYREETRDARRVRWWAALRQDLGLSFRLMGRNPWFSTAVILTLALGIGANTAIFSVLDAVLFSESPFAEPDRLVMVWETDRASDNVHEPASWPDIVDFRERSRTLESIAAVVGQDFTHVAGGEPERVMGLGVTPNLFEVLGVRPIVGRLFHPAEGLSASQPVVVLSEAFWREMYGADPSLIGRAITVNEQSATVVGVVPAAADLGVRQIHDRADYAPSFGGGAVQIWQAMRPSAEAFPRETHPFLTLARLAPGVSHQAAQEELAGIAAELEAAYSENDARGVNLEPYSEVVFGPVRSALWVLLGAVALVLLVACANVANLLLARTTARTREVAVRQALGAAAGRIRTQFLVESLVLTALGAVTGVALAYGGLETLVALAPADIPRLAEATVDGRVLAYTAGIAMVVALTFGILPSIQARRLDIQGALKAQSTRSGTEGRAGRRFRSALVVAEVALAVVLVVGAALLLRSLWQLENVDPGFDTERVLKAEYQLPESRYPLDFSRWPDIPEITDLHARFLAGVRSIPGVEAAAIAGGHPLDPGFTNSFSIVGREAESAGLPEIRARFLTPGYLGTLGVELVEGRMFDSGDDVRATPVVVLNRTAAERYFPDGNAIGQQLSFWGTARQVVGIIGDEKFNGIDAPTDPAAYAPLYQNPQQVATLMVRAAGDPQTLVPQIREQLHTLDPQLALFGVEPLAATVSESIARPRFLATLLGLFGGLAILLALIGVHGVLSYTVARRAPELGIRMALGARRSTVLRSVLGEGLGLAAAGIILGVAAAWVGSRVLGSLLFGVTTSDPATFIAVPAIVLLVSIVASLVPALRASRVDPMGPLRTE